MANAGVGPGRQVRRRRALLVVALVVVLVASVAAARVVTTPPDDPLDRSAAADARENAYALRAALADAVEDVGDEPWELVAAFEYAWDVAGQPPYEPVDPGEAEAAWRVQVPGFASWGGGVLSESAEAAVCVDVVVDRDVDPSVRLVDAACLTELRYAEERVSVERSG